LTVRCLDGLNILKNRKEIVFEIFSNIFQDTDVSLYAFVILDNHYHLLLEIGMTSRKGVGIPRIINRCNCVIAKKLNEIDGCKGRKVFYQYWDWCIRDEKDFYSHFNYIHGNPIKHGLVKDFEELKNYKFCSYSGWVKKAGEEFLHDCLMAYPVVDYQKDN